MDRPKIEILNSENFSDEVFSRKELTIVEFQDEENASCLIMTPVYNRLQELYSDKIVCFTVSKPEAPELWDQFQIFQTPSYLLFKDNKTVEKITGLISYDNFKSIVERSL